jgi:hypothetical protein
MVGIFMLCSDGKQKLNKSYEVQDFEKCWAPKNWEILYRIIKNSATLNGLISHL